MQNIKNLETKLKNLQNKDVSVNLDVKGLDKLKSTVESIRKQKVKLEVDIDKNVLNTLGNLKVPKMPKIKPEIDTSGVKKAKADFQMLKKVANDLNSKKIKFEELNLSPEKNANQITALGAQIKQLESDYKSLHNTFGQSLDASQIGKLESEFGKTEDKIQMVVAKSKDMQQALTVATKASEKFFDTNKSTTASNNTLNWLENNSKAAKKYGEELKRLAEIQAKAQTSADLSLANNTVKAIQSEAKLEGLAGQTFSGQLKSNLGNVGQVAASYLTLQQGIRLAKGMATEVMAVDSAMTELRKVSNAPAGDVTNYFSTAAKSAKELGSSISDIIEMTANWSRVGFSLDESAELANVTALYQNVGDNMTADSASESLISTMKGFGLAADEALSIVDRFNAVKFLPLCA